MPAKAVEIGGCETTVEQFGSGAPILVLQGKEGPRAATAFLEVYEPWLAERGLKRLLLPKGGRRPGPGPVSDSGTAACTGITGVRHDESKAA